MAKPRVAVCGIHIESSTFTPYLSTAADFDITRGDALLARFSWLDKEWAQRIEWIPVLHCRALPGGVVYRPDYDAWKAEMVEGLKKLTAEAPLDGLFFDIHGAMSVQGMDDAEGDLITALREVIGDEPCVSACMDLHGNVSHELFNGCDLMTCYRMAPHEDALESRERAMRNLAEALTVGPKKPAKALVHVPVLLPGEKTSTRIEPAKSLYAQIPVELDSHPGVTDVSIWIGFAWADQPRCKGAVVAYGPDAAQVEEVARKIGKEFWDRGEAFEFVAPVDTMDGCLEYARTAPAPFFISDSGDNPGAGGADDVTYALKRLLAWEPARTGEKTAIYASLVDPEATDAAWEAGVGATIDVSVGGKIDTREPGPLPVHAEVVGLTEEHRAGRMAALRVGGVTFIVTAARFQFAELYGFHDLGLDPAKADVVVVKIGYLEPELYNLQADWKMALTPGGVDQDLIRLGHHKIDRPMIPFDPASAFGFGPEPDLETTVIP